MILKIKNLDSSNLLNIDFFEMRNKGLTPDVHAHRSDAYFDLIIRDVKSFFVETTCRNVAYRLYPSNMDISPFTLTLPYGEELIILKEA